MRGWTLWVHEDTRRPRRRRGGCTSDSLVAHSAGGTESDDAAGFAHKRPRWLPKRRGQRAVGPADDLSNRRQRAHRSRHRDRAQTRFIVVIGSFKPPRGEKYVGALSGWPSCRNASPRYWRVVVRSG